MEGVAVSFFVYALHCAQGVFPFAVAILALYVLWNVAWKLLDVRDKRRADKKFRQFWANRPKAQITQVGHLVRDPQGRLRPQGFRLNGAIGNTVVPEWMRGPDGELAWGGYTEDELVEMVRRRSEFQP